MLRYLIAVTALAVLIPLAVSAPKSKDDRLVYYFPTTVGDKLVHERRNSAKGVELLRVETSQVVTKVEKKDKHVIVSVGIEPDGQNVGSTYRSQVSEEGLFNLGTSEEKASDPPACLLKLPAKAGDTWKNGVATYTTVGEEEVEVPAGKFKAIRLRVKRSDSDETVHMWWARGVGLVKLHLENQGDEYFSVLKSFTPGKK